jgi:hypothetical protein
MSIPANGFFNISRENQLLSQNRQACTDYIQFIAIIQKEVFHLLNIQD